MTVYIICPALVRVALLGFGREAYSPPIVVPDVSFTAGFCPLVFFSFTRCISTPWIFSWAGFSDVSDLDSLEGYALGGSFDVFYVRYA